MRRKNTLPIILIFLAVSLSILSVCSADNTTADKITDLSDRKYEQILIKLLDDAKESIVISMYGISLGFGEKNPVRLLLNDLLEARKRGVSVTMYLNTRFRDADKAEESFIRSPIFKELKDAGCDIYLIPPSRKLHDKLIIVDSRFVIVGSTNWSNSALRRNFESNTLIDSTSHAQEKLKRLEDVTSFVKSNSEISDTPAYLEELPEELSIPKELLTNKKYFARMVTGQDNRVFDLYFLFLAHSQLIGEKEFFINMEDMALSLELPDTWDYTALRRQVIRSLKRLQNRYNLITVEFLYGKDASVALLDIPGESFAIFSNTIIQGKNPNLTLRLKFLLLIEVLLKSEGGNLSSIPKSDLAKRFNVNKTTIQEAFKDLHGQRTVP
jgi:cardiolipin synthase